MSGPRTKARRLRLTTVLPTAALAVALVIAGLAMRPRDAFHPDFGAPPDMAELPRPELDIGTQTLVGRVLGEGGSPLVDASVLVVQHGRPSWTSTDRAGIFRLESLKEGAVRVAVNHPRYPATIFDAEVGAGTVTLELPEKLPRPPVFAVNERAELRGVARVPGREDMRDFEVALFPLGPPNELGIGVPRRALTEPDGSFTIPELDMVEYEVRLLPPYARGGTWPNLMTGLDGPPVTFTHVGSTEELDLVSSAGGIAGRVLRAGGGPLTGAMVAVLPMRAGVDAPADPRRFPAVQTDTEGAFLVPLLPPGSYRVTLTAGSERREVDVVVPPSATVDPEF